jgi:hypothetical protein
MPPLKKLVPLKEKMEAIKTPPSSSLLGGSVPLLT